MDDATKAIQKAKVRAEYLKASKCLVEMLKTARYNGGYFDRTEKEPNRLCTQEGWFTCQVLQEQNHLQGVDRSDHMTFLPGFVPDQVLRSKTKPLNQHSLHVLVRNLAITTIL